MKKVTSLLVVCGILLALCACNHESAPTTTATAPQTTASTEPVHFHSYRDADCVSPKTCTDCGETRGDALGHNYIEGICSRCGKEDATYVALCDGNWRFDALHESGTQLEYISLRFDEDGTASFSARIYNRLSDVPEAERDSNMLNEENWYDYSGEIYYYAGNSVRDELVYTIDGDLITCELRSQDTVYGTLILERTGGNMLTVTYFEGEFSIQYLQVGDVLSSGY